MSALAGFDRSYFPGLPVMTWLIANTNLRVCAPYLAPAPDHGERSWMGHRQELLDMGWRLYPVYVGRQVCDNAGRLIINPSVNAAQGAGDGADACRLMAGEGYAKGSTVFLDIENGLPLGTAQREYVASWIDAVGAAGYTPGVYCSFQMAAQIAALRPSVKIWVFHVKTTRPHRVPGTIFPTPDPATSGYPSAVMWQRDDEAEISCPAALGGLLTVDLNVADSADPSAPVI